MLTPDECRVVAEAAKRYPEGYGHEWMASRSHPLRCNDIPRLDKEELSKFG